MFQHQRLEVPRSRTLEGPVCSDIQGFEDQSEGGLSKSILTIIKFFTSDLSQSFSNSALLIFCADLFFFMNTYTVQGTTYSSISGPPPGLSIVAIKKVSRYCHVYTWEGREGA